MPKPPAALQPDDKRHHDVIPAQRGFHRIAACLDGSELSECVLPHARAVASALGTPLSLLRVIESGGPGAAPPDPLDWDILRCDARDYLERLIGAREESKDVEAEVIEGAAAEQICVWTEHHGADLTVVASHGVRGRTGWSLASTARKLLDRLPGSILLVPVTAEPSGPVVRYRRLLAPLDGSARAESVLPLALQLAKAHGAELLLAHVVPVPELTEIGPLEAEDVELRERLIERNERVAHAYLDRLRSRLAHEGVALRALVLTGGDARPRLLRLVADEAIDLVVLSAHGRSGQSNVPFGSVAAHLMEHAGAPILIFRPHTRRSMQRVMASAEHARMPSQAIS